MKKILLIVLPSLLLAEISNDLYRDCSNAKYDACYKIGSARMDISSPDYNPSLGVSYLESACNAGISYGCSSLSSYYDKKGDKQRSKSYLKKSCDLKDSWSCYLYNQKRGD